VADYATKTITDRETTPPEIADHLALDKEMLRSCHIPSITVTADSSDDHHSRTVIAPIPQD